MRRGRPLISAAGGWPVRAALTAAVAAVLILAGRGLRGEALGNPLVAPNGIVSLELAGTAERAGEIIELWTAGGVVGAARSSLWMDFGFIVLYTATLAMWVRWAMARKERAWWRAVGRVALVVVIAAAMADVAENVLLLRVLDGPAPLTTAWARRCALAKFGLLAGAVSYVLASSSRGTRSTS